MDDVVLARNPDPGSALPCLLRLPLPRPVVLKARETWPRTAKVSCHRAQEWPDEPEDLARSLVDGRLSAQLAERATLPHAAVVVGVLAVPVKGRVPAVVVAADEAAHPSSACQAPVVPRPYCPWHRKHRRRRGARIGT